MTIGEILDAIANADDEASITFDFGGISPTKVDSWRGSYDEAAIGFSSGQYGEPCVTVKQFRAALQIALTPGVTYSGWKGGEYQYTKSTPLHVDNRGCYSNTEISRVEVQDWGVILHTDREAQ